METHPRTDLLAQRPRLLVLLLAVLLVVGRVGLPVQVELPQGRLSHVFTLRLDAQLVDDGRLVPGAGGKRGVRAAAQNLSLPRQGFLRGYRLCDRGRCPSALAKLSTWRATLPKKMPKESLAEAGFPVPDEGEAERVEDIDELDELQEAAAKEARPLASTRRARAKPQWSATAWTRSWRAAGACSTRCPQLSSPGFLFRGIVFQFFVGIFSSLWSGWVLFLGCWVVLLSC